MENNLLKLIRSFVKKDDSHTYDSEKKTYLMNVICDKFCLMFVFVCAACLHKFHN